MQNVLINRENIWIVGLSIDSLEEKPSLFVLIQTGEIDTPIKENGKVLIFQKKSLIKYLFEKHEILIIGDELYEQLEIVLNISILLHKIKYCKIDTDCTIIDSLNIFFDMTKHLHKKGKKQVNVRIFYSFANHLTFEKEFAQSFIKKNGISRAQLLDSIYWNVGLLFANSQIV